MVVFTKNILCQLAEFPDLLFRSTETGVLNNLSERITLIIKIITKQMSNAIFSGKKKMIYDLDSQFRNWIRKRDKQYQTIANILIEILVPELKKKFIDSKIYTEIKIVTDVYDNETQHNILIIDWN